nr:MAG TPA: hypothetical protein [Caudoviricetes sp.]
MLSARQIIMVRRMKETTIIFIGENYGYYSN